MYKSISKHKPPLKLWVKVKRQIGKAKPEFESIGMLRGENLPWIVKHAKGVNGNSITHWDYLE